MSHNTPAICLQKGQHIKLFVMDIDGILTDGGLYFDGHGEMIKRFNVQDGLGLLLLKQASVKLATISGKTSEPAQFRLNALNFDDIHLNIKNKTACFEKLLAKYNLNTEHVAYMGDDLPDLPLLARAGLSISVPNAHETAKQAADCITNNTGGHGAVREACDYILAAQNKLEGIIQSFCTHGEWVP